MNNKPRTKDVVSDRKRRYREEPKRKQYKDGFGNTRSFCAEFNRRADAYLKRKGAQ